MPQAVADHITIPTYNDAILGAKLAQLGAATDARDALTAEYDAMPADLPIAAFRAIEARQADVAGVYWDIAKQVEATPAATLAGLRTKTRATIAAFEWFHPDGISDDDLHMAYGLFHEFLALTDHLEPDDNDGAELQATAGEVGANA